MGVALVIWTFPGDEQTVLALGTVMQLCPPPFANAGDAVTSAHATPLISIPETM